MYDDTKLMRGLSELGLSAGKEQLEQLHHYYEMMVETNRVMNLTAITEYEDVCVKHWLDSLCLVKVLPGLASGEAVSMIDVGTGAGFPGVPLKILFPQIRLTLLDSLGKRISFLERVVAECGLSDVTCLHARAEEYSRKEEYREAYDVCVSRAVTRLASLTELCLPYVKVGGKFIPYKSGDCAGEVAEAGLAITTLGGKLEETAAFSVPESDLGRTLLVISKKRATDRKYPRGGGKPMKSPIVSRETF